jgi:hypothetical protein
VAVFTDAGVSGACWDAPALLDLLRAAQEGTFDTLICLDPDRLSRSLGKLAVVEEQLRGAGVAITYVNLRLSDDARGAADGQLPWRLQRVRAVQDVTEDAEWEAGEGPQGPGDREYRRTVRLPLHPQRIRPD